jgi:predicted ribosome quality control (RQC) complex YloA/Tae2 family protein
VENVSLPISYPALFALAEYLANTWVGKKLMHSFTQEKEELMLGLEDEQYLRIRCSARLQFVVPQSGFSRSNANSVSVFPDALNQTIHEIRIIPDDRVIWIQLDQHELWIKMYGNRSNVILSKQGDFIQSFLKKTGESEWLKTQFKNKISPTIEIPGWAQSAYWKSIPGYDLGMQESRLELLKASTQATWGLSTSGIPALQFTISEGLPIAEALPAWMYQYLSFTGFQEEYQKILQGVQQQVHYLKTTWEATTKGLEKLHIQRDPEELGHLILANLHQIKSEQDKLECQDLYSGESMIIPLKQGLSGPEQAEWYYEKSRKWKAEKARCQKLLEDIEIKLPQKEKELESLTMVHTLKGLRQWRKEFPEAIPLKKNSSQDLEDRQPWREFTLSGWFIRVGKDAKSNDELTLRGSKSGDLWLHVKDFSGSHVVVRQKNGQPVPDTVMQQAAQLAVWFSPRRHHTLVAVNFCDRKFVRKNKRMAAGAVLVDRAQSILVDSPKTLLEILSP